MFRYLYQQKHPLTGLVRRQYEHFKWEEQGYMSALLARARVSRLQGNDDPLKAAYEDINLLEIDEHYAVATSDHVEQTFKLLNALNKTAALETDLVLNRRYEELSSITSIVDPDKFPIFSLIETIDTHDLVSVWSYKKELLPKLQSALGFTLAVAASTIEHHAAGEGVFLHTYAPNVSSIPTGQLLGFIGGVSYQSLTDFTNTNVNMSFAADSYLHRPDNTVIDFDQKIPYPFIFGMSLQEYYLAMAEREEREKVHIKEVPCHFINPFAVGHKINHPPKFTAPNVILLDMHIPRHFFAEAFMKFFPYISAETAQDEGKILKAKKKTDLKDGNVHAVGVFALRDIKDGEELFMDYIENNMFDVAHTPDWMVKPPPLSPEYKKNQFNFEFSILARLIDQYVLQRSLSVYEKFNQQVSHDPLRANVDENNDLLKKSHPKLLQKFMKKYEDDGVQEGHFAKKIAAAAASKVTSGVKDTSV